MSQSSRLLICRAMESVDLSCEYYPASSPLSWQVVEVSGLFFLFGDVRWLRSICPIGPNLFYVSFQQLRAYSIREHCMTLATGTAMGHADTSTPVMLEVSVRPDKERKTTKICSICARFQYLAKKNKQASSPSERINGCIVRAFLFLRQGAKTTRYIQWWKSRNIIPLVNCYNLIFLEWLTTSNQCKSELGSLFETLSFLDDNSYGNILLLANSYPFRT